MKNNILLILIIICSYSCKKGTYSEKYDNLTILHLDGKPYERGLAHGQLLRQEINSVITKWKEEVEKEYKDDFNKIIQYFFETTNYVSAIKEYCPELLEEVYGIASGCAIEYETILAFQLSEELSTFSDEYKNKHCTSISINKSNNSPTILSQNMDPELYLHGYPTLLHITDQDLNLETFVYTFPGFIGLNGLNSSGVAITCNSISMLNKSKHGLPVSFIVRSILKQKHEQTAFDFLKNIPLGIPQCFTIGGISEARCFECSTNEIKEFYPFKEKKITLHTNFAAVNRDFNQHYIDLLAEYGKTIDDPYYCPRYFLAYDKIRDFDYKLNYKNIKSILSLTEPEIQPISNNETYGCLIMELSNEPKLYIAPGKPDVTEFIELKFDEKR